MTAPRIIKRVSSRMIGVLPKTKVIEATVARALGAAPDEPLKWDSSVQLFVRATRADGRMLMCNVLTHDNARWIVGAVETSITAVIEGGVFSDHGHKAIGTYPDLREAMDAAESYARAWQKKYKATAAPACACDEIPAE